MINARLTLEGYDEAIRLMDKLPDALQKRVMQQIFVRSLKPIISGSRQKLLGYGPRYKNLAKSIGTWNGKSRTSPSVYVGPRVKGRWSDVGYIANWVEYGTAGIKTKNKGTRSWKRTPENEAFAKWVGTVKRGGKYRNAQPARPFMRPAVDENIERSKQIAEKLMREELQAFIDKNLKRMRA